MSSQIVKQGFTDKALFEKIRQSLVPRGTSDLVRLEMGAAPYFHYPIVEQAINELEAAINTAKALGEPLSASHRLILELFMASAHIVIPEEVQTEAKKAILETKLRESTGTTKESKKSRP